MREIPHTSAHSTESHDHRGTASVEGLLVSVTLLATVTALMAAPAVTAGGLVGAVSLKSVQSVDDRTKPTTPPPGGDASDSPTS